MTRLAAFILRLVAKPDPFMARVNAYRAAESKALRNSQCRKAGEVRRNRYAFTHAALSGRPQ